MSEASKTGVNADLPKQAPMIRFFVAGIPQPGGSKRAFRSKHGHMIVTDANPKVRTWRGDVRDAYYAAAPDAGMLSGPLAIRIHLIFPRPKSHYRTGRHSGELRADAPCWHTTRPDASKCLRATEDALIGIAYDDDCRIASVTVWKQYGTPAGAHVTIEAMADEEVMPDGTKEAQA